MALTLNSGIDPAPLIRARIRDQLCFTNNGNLTLSVSGSDGPCLGSLNGGLSTTDFTFDSLAPSTYRIGIQDENGCHYNTSFVIRAYPRDAVTLSIDSLNPVCTQLNSGAVTVAVQGDQAPYWQPEGLYVWEVNYVDLENIARTAHGTVLLIR